MTNRFFEPCTTFLNSLNKRGEVSVQLIKQEIKKNTMLVAKFFLGFKFPIAMLLTDSMGILPKWLVVISYRPVIIVRTLTYTGIHIHCRIIS